MTNAVGGSIEKLGLGNKEICNDFTEIRNDSHGMLRSTAISPLFGCRTSFTKAAVTFAFT
jgi:hypothetical protein